MERSTRARRSVDGVYRKKKCSDDFYADVDASSRKFVGFWSLVIIILALIFIVFVGLAISARRKMIDPQSLKVENQSTENLVSFAQRLSTIISSGQTMLLFNSLELTKASGAAESDFPLKNAKFVITKDNLYLSGKIPGSLIFWPLKLRIKSEATGQKFNFTIDDGSLENIILPTSDKEKINDIFDKNFNQPLLEKNLSALDIRLSDGQIELYVVKGVK